jgi:hypothetical protein
MAAAVAAVELGGGKGVGATVGEQPSIIKEISNSNDSAVLRKLDIPRI